MRNFENKPPRVKKTFGSKFHSKTLEKKVTSVKSSESSGKEVLSKKVQENVEPATLYPEPQISANTFSVPEPPEKMELTEEEKEEQIKLGTEMILRRIEAVVSSMADSDQSSLDLDEVFEASKQANTSAQSASTSNPDNLTAAMTIRSLGYSCLKGQTVLLQKLKEMDVNSALSIQTFIQDNADILVKRNPSERAQITRSSIRAVGNMNANNTNNASKGDYVSVSLLKYLLCSIGERLTESEFQLLLCDLDVDFRSGEIPIPSLLYLLNAQGGYPPGEDKKKQRRAKLRGQRPTFAKRTSVNINTEKRDSVGF